MNDDLDNNIRDRLVAVVRGAAGVVPIFGGILGEIVGQVIPSQRQDRIVSYLRILETRINEMDQVTQQRILTDIERIDMIEAGAYSAARATSSERIMHIISIVANGIADDKVEIIRKKRLLTIFDEIDDDQVMILTAFGQSYGGDAQAAWNNISRPGPIHLQSSKDEIEDGKLFELGQDRLRSIGLLKKNFRSVKKGMFPEFDPQVGDFKGRLEISYLGRLLLREIGVELPVAL